MAPNKKKEIIDNGNCLVCLTLCEDPVTTSCKHTFCRQCIEFAIEDEPKCPACGTKVNIKDLQEVVVATASTTNASKKAKNEETTANAPFHFGSLHEEEYLTFSVKNGELFIFNLKTREDVKIANQNFNCSGSKINIFDWTKNKLPYKVENEEQMKMRVSNDGFITATDCNFRVFTQGDLLNSLAKMRLNCGYHGCGSNTLLYFSNNLQHFTNESFSGNKVEVIELKNCTINILLK